MSVTKLEAFCKGLQTRCVDLVLAVLTARLHWLSLPGNVKRKKKNKTSKQKDENGLREATSEQTLNSC